MNAAPDLHWKTGEVLVLRGVWRHVLYFACPVMVVQDDPDLIALYWRAGTRCKRHRDRVTAQALLAAKRVELIDFTWSGTDVLMLATSGEWHSVWAMWETGQSQLRCWYVNLEAPLRRSSLGFDTMDFELDIVISPDRSNWHWKDEHQFEEMVAGGVFSGEEARYIRAEGERVIQKMQANQPPFCDGWDQWSPPALWSKPELPPGWDVLGEPA